MLPELIATNRLVRPNLPEEVFHVTVLSNFARAYDKYRRVYSKAAIPESTYPDEFYVLLRHDLGIGIRKAANLKDRLGISGNELLVIEARLPSSSIRLNLRNGLGRVWPSPDLPVHRVHLLRKDGTLSPLPIEDAISRSLALNNDRFLSYSQLSPRSISFLPIARGCQARCPFCFSNASASMEQDQSKPDWVLIDRWTRLAKSKGAHRGVITGGGEPTLLKWQDLFRMIELSDSVLGRTVLITNGLTLASSGSAERFALMASLRKAGLSVLAVSRHHMREDTNSSLMGLETQTPAVLRTFKRNSLALTGLRMRLVCVLQQGGIQSASDVDAYVNWAASQGAQDICFKELYVSTSAESLYHSADSNQWSREHQVSLAVVHAWAERRGLVATSRLPWGAPIYQAVVGGRTMRVAAYTEPSVYWERTNGLARSWNVMADGTCLASLEDRRSTLALDSLRGLSSATERGSRSLGRRAVDAGL